jgi:hypothetical protein
LCRLHDDHLVFVADVALEMIPAQADLVADEFVASLNVWSPSAEIVRSRRPRPRFSTSALSPSPTAKISVSEFLNHVRPPQATVAIVSSNVSAADNSICRRLLLTTCEREGGFSGFGVGTSALMAQIRTGMAIFEADLPPADRKKQKNSDISQVWR